MHDPDPLDRVEKAWCRCIPIPTVVPMAESAISRGTSMLNTSVTFSHLKVGPFQGDIRPGWTQAPPTSRPVSSWVCRRSRAREGTLDITQQVNLHNFTRGISSNLRPNRRDFDLEVNLKERGRWEILSTDERS